MYENTPYFDPKEGTTGNRPDEIAAQFSLCMKRGDSPDSPAAQSAAEQWCSTCTGYASLDPQTYGHGINDYISDAVAFYRKGR